MQSDAASITAKYLVNPYPADRVLLQAAVAELQSGKLHALVTGQEAVHQPHLHRINLLVLFDMPDSIDGYISTVSRAGPAADSCIVLLLLTLAHAALAQPLTELLQVCTALQAAQALRSISPTVQVQECGQPVDAGLQQLAAAHRQAVAAMQQAS